MIRLEMPPEKAEMLREVLASHLAELRLEMDNAGVKEFREFLRRRSDLLEKFLHRLEEELAAGGKPWVPLDRLRKVDILQGLTDWELKIVSQFFQKESLEGGVMLCREGENAERLFILEEGSVSIRTQGREPMTMDAPGSIVGWSFLVPPNRYTATATTLVPSKMLVIKSPEFSYLIHKEPRMGIKVMANLAQVVAGRLAKYKGYS